MSGKFLIFILAGAAIVAPRTVHIPAASNKYKAIVIREAHAQGGLAAPVAMFAGQLCQESGFTPRAHSAVGAQGIAQFMPATATWIGRIQPKDFPTPNANDPQWSIRAMMFYDYWLKARVSVYSENEQWAAALSAYNGGLGNTLKAAKRGHCSVWFGCAETTDVGRSKANQEQNVGYPQAILKKWAPAFLRAGWQ